MKKIIIQSILFLVCIGLNAQTKISFQPSPKSKYHYRQTVTQTIKQTYMGQEIPMEQEISTGYDMDISGVQNNSVQAQFVYKFIEYLVSTPMFTIEYHSEKQPENPTAQDVMIRKLFQTLIDKPFDMVISADGTVESVTGMDQIMDEMILAVSADGLDVKQMAESIKQQYSDVAIKNNFEQSLKIYPDQPVKAGDSWEKSHQIQISGMNAKTISFYTLKEIKKKKAYIDVRSDIELVPGPGVEGTISGTQAGTIEIDIKSGIPLSSGITQNLSGTITVSGIPVSMEILSQVNSTTTKRK